MNVSSTITEAATEKNSIKELFCKNVIPLNWSAIIFQIFSIRGLQVMAMKPLRFI